MSPTRFGKRERYDAVVVGSGPNGLSAAIVLAQAGLSTLVIEAHATPGGGTRTQALTLPGFSHDICSTVHPLGVVSPLLAALELERYGVRWLRSPLALAHVLADGRAVTLQQSVEHTASGLAGDAQAYADLFAPLVERHTELWREILGPLRLPRSPLLLARFGLSALRSLQGLARGSFSEEPARALLAGMAAHAMQPLDRAATASFALVLALAGHAVGWPIAEAGSGTIASALTRILQEAGGELVLDSPVKSFAQLPAARAYLFDVTPRQLVRIAGSELPRDYRRKLARFRYGPGVCKLDWALSGPIPWRDPACARAATVHLGGDLAEVAEAEAAVSRGQLSSRPFVILVQPSLFDPTRAPAGQHTAWAYCHVPWGSSLDAGPAIERQVERFAPGFSRLVLARASRTATEMERYNENYVGGDINGGSALLSQLFTRPVARLDPYTTPARHIFLCSSSTPPGGGVHGMCGFWAAQSALRRVFGARA